MQHPLIKGYWRTVNLRSIAAGEANANKKSSGYFTAKERFHCRFAQIGPYANCVAPFLICVHLRKSAANLGAPPPRQVETAHRLPHPRIKH
jgi:hypothetical protein